MVPLRSHRRERERVGGSATCDERYHVAFVWGLRHRQGPELPPPAVAAKRARSVRSRSASRRPAVGQAPRRVLTGSARPAGEGRRGGEAAILYLHARGPNDGHPTPVPKIFMRIVESSPRSLLRRRKGVFASQAIWLRPRGALRLRSSVPESRHRQAGWLRLPGVPPRPDQ